MRMLAALTRLLALRTNCTKDGRVVSNSEANESRDPATTGSRSSDQAARLGPGYIYPHSGCPSHRQKVRDLTKGMGLPSMRY